MEKSTGSASKKKALPKLVFACPTCEVTFITGDSWKTHRRERHGYEEGPETQNELLSAVRAASTLLEISSTETPGAHCEVEPDDPLPAKDTNVTDKKGPLKRNLHRKRLRSVSAARQVADSAVPVRQPGKQTPVYAPKRKTLTGGEAPPSSTPIETPGSVPLANTVLIRSATETSSTRSESLQSVGPHLGMRNIQPDLNILRPEVVSTHDLVTLVNEQPSLSAFDLALAISQRANIHPTEERMVRSRLSAIIAARKDVAQRIMRILLGLGSGEEREALLGLVDELMSSPALRGFE